MFKKIEKQKLILLGIILLIVIFLIIKILDKNYQNEENTQINTDILGKTEYEEETEEKIIIYITGEVEKEGVIELTYGSRIADAIEKAGGLTERANIKNVNLAYELEDGQKIYIPNIEDQEVMVIDDFGSGIEDLENKEEIININKANIEQLQKLNGIGESLAQSIIQYREENGKFNTIEDLMNVPGIGESKFNIIKDYIKVK